MSDFSPGGILSGPPMRFTIQRTGQCVRGHCLYSIDGEQPEHIITADEVRRRDHSKIDCQRELEETQALRPND